MYRKPGEDGVCDRWAEALDVARQGKICNLRILTLDVIMAPNDGVDRCSL
jgi:hypothetical protein